MEEPKQKDTWDKADIVAKFISSIVIAGIGIYLTTTIQKTQIEFSKSNAENEVKIKQATLTSQLIQYLTSADTNQRKIAVIALHGNLTDNAYQNIIKVVALGDNNKNVRITAIDQLGLSSNKESITTLTSISLNNNLPTDERKAALQASVNVSVNSSNASSNWCFIGAGQNAFESELLQGGFFTNSLVNYLNSNSSNSYTIDDLYSNLNSSMNDSSKAMGGFNLHPVLSYGKTFSKTINLSPNNNAKYIIIGSDNYTNGNFLALQFAIKDANRFKNLLLEKYKIKPENIISTYNPTRNTLLNELKEISKGLDANVNIIIYYSGHSHLSSTEGLQLIPTDYKEASSGVPLTSLYNNFLNCGYVLVFWDACTYDYK